MKRIFQRLKEKLGSTPIKLSLDDRESISLEHKNLIYLVEYESCVNCVYIYSIYYRCKSIDETYYICDIFPDGHPLYFFKEYPANLDSITEEGIDYIADSIVKDLNESTHSDTLSKSEELAEELRQSYSKDVLLMCAANLFKSLTGKELWE